MGSAASEMNSIRGVGKLSRGFAAGRLLAGREERARAARVIARKPTS